MITLCCDESFFDFSINWEAITAIGTAILAIATIYLLIEAKKQLGRIKEFIEKYTKAVKDGAALSYMQSAENNVLKQIDFHYIILERIEANQKDAFRIMYENLKGNYGFEKDKPPTIEEQISVAFGKLYGDYGYLLGHYYRNLYRIFKNINDIDDTKIIGFDKKYYAKLVRAQLSEYEIILLFYNCIWVGDNNKFKILVDRYELLEGINYDKLFDREHYKLFSESAFGVDLI